MILYQRGILFHDGVSINACYRYGFCLVKDGHYLVTVSTKLLTLG